MGLGDQRQVTVRVVAGIKEGRREEEEGRRTGKRERRVKKRAATWETSLPFPVHRHRCTLLSQSRDQMGVLEQNQNKNVKRNSI